MTSAAPGRVLALAASAFVVLAAEPLYLLVDTAVVGHLGTRALAGLGGHWGWARGTTPSRRARRAPQDKCPRT